MKTIAWHWLLVLVAGCVGVTALDAASSSPCPSGKEALEIMKGLAGEWQGKGSEQGRELGIRVYYRVTSGGSAVLETLFPGTDHEMVTMYYLDGGKLMLTHYCAMGNQPRMALQKNSTAQDLMFDFIGGSNINPRKDTHMHAARILLQNPDAITGEWMAYKDGKPADVTKFALTRTR
jgi:hypothetical protein